MFKVSAFLADTVKQTLGDLATVHHSCKMPQIA